MVRKAKKDDKISEAVKQDPPPRRQAYDWSMIALQLRENPNVWHMIFERDRVTVANAIRQGSITVLHPDLGFEVQTRNNVREPPPRMCSLYLRFNSEKVNELADVLRQAREGTD